MQGTYLDTILPRADLAENQAAMPEIGENDDIMTWSLVTGHVITPETDIV